MKLRDIILTCGLAVFAGCAEQQPVSSDTKIDKSMELIVQKKFDDAEWLLLDEERQAGQRPSIDFLLAKIYTERNKAPTRDNIGDAALGILRWERVLQRDSENKEYLNKLLTCRKALAEQHYNTAQMLFISDMKPDNRKLAKEEFHVETYEEAKNLAFGAYAKAIIQLKPVVKGMPDDAKAWAVLGDCYANIDSNVLALDAYKHLAKLKPDEPKVYLAIAVVYIKNNMTWAIVDEIDSAPEDEREYKRRMMGKAAVYAFDEFAKKGVSLSFITQTPEQSRKLAQVLYLTSSLGWEEEMKKEKITDRNYTQPLQQLFWGAAFDFLGAKTEDEKEQVLKRLENGYDPINKGLEDGLGTLEKVYEHNLKTGRLRVIGAPQLLQSLKERYAPKKEAPKKEPPQKDF